LINSLKRERAVGVGATPGYTRAMQEVHIDKHVKLLDCPGIVFSESSSESDLVLRNCIKVEQITDTVKPGAPLSPTLISLRISSFFVFLFLTLFVVTSVDLILSRCRREKLMELYKIPIYHDTREFLCHIAHKRGKLGKVLLPRGVGCVGRTR
jgi:nuclear GTP-binding protein